MVRVLITGAGGQLGQAVAAAFTGTCEVVGLDHAALDVADRDAVLQATGALRPHVVVHAAAWTAVDACEEDPERAYRVNALGTRHLAEGAEQVDAHLCYVSTDYVFDGRTRRPYTEWDDANPLSVYGRSKLGGERACPPGATIVRTSWLSGATGAGTARVVLDLAARQRALRFVDDQWGSPTVATDLAGALRRLAIERRPGVFHVTNQGEATWYGFARAVLAAAGEDPDRVEPVTRAELQPPRPAPRPAYSVLDNLALRCSGLPLLPDWRESVEALVKELCR
ncbi:MAG TPA: dTDP-4-dehydrorhamnose reductase [Acidimicrobiales bacterium]|nr:dTDP-4-dehydrorhamnose reductase [Acidimicrobiales bacterium]